MPPVPLASRLRRVTTRFSTFVSAIEPTASIAETCTSDGDRRPCCDQGMQTCVAGVWGSCEGAFVSNESCNGIDDDCDGSVDELGTVTCGMGACERTVSACEGGVLATCLPGSPAAASDDCNGADDDCDGAIDEDCATCVRVSTTGDDAAATASCGAIPFATVQAAIDFADVHRSEVTRVCVAAGAACGGTATFAGPAGADLTMRNGISVLANYEWTSWTRCSSSTTRLAPQTGRGVVFPPAVAERTVLDGFAIDRFLAETSAGVTVDGARGVLLSNLSVVGGPPVTTSYGVNVVNGGDALLFRNRIETATAFEQGIALRAVGSRVVVQDSCPTSPDAATGRCTSVCSGSGPEIRATYALATFDLPRAVSTRAIVLDDSPGSRIERSAVCWKTDLYGRLGAGSAIEIAGDATGDVVRASSIRLEAAGPLQAVTPTKVAVSLVDCVGAAAWIVDNSVTAYASELGAVIEASGDCHPVIEWNPSIVATIPSWHRSGAALSCLERDGISSRCVVANNSKVENEWVSLPYHLMNGINGTGVLCTGTSCARIDENNIVGARGPTGGSGSGLNVYGVGISLSGGSALIRGNDVTGACSNACNSAGVGVSAVAANGILEGNEVLGACGRTGGPCGRFSGVGLAIASTPADEWVIRSNTIRATPGSPCGAPVCSQPFMQSPQSPPVAVSLNGTAGVFIDNTMSPGACRDGTAFAEYGSAPAHPRIFQDNHLTADPRLVDVGPLRGSLYKDSVAGYLLTAAEVNALTDTQASGTSAEICPAP